MRKDTVYEKDEDGMSEVVLHDSLYLLEFSLCVFVGVYVLAMHTRGSPASQAQVSLPAWGHLTKFSQDIETRLMRIKFISDVRSQSRLARRRMMCLNELPVLLDVVILGLSAGLSFNASLELYCAHYSGSLSEVFKEVLMCERLGVMSKREGLVQLSEKMQLDALSRFISSVIQALECGSPLVDILQGQAQAIRDAQQSELEEQIEKVPVKMLIPMGVLIVPAMLIAILGPLVAAATSS